MLTNPNTVAEFLASTDTSGNPCPINPMDDFWCNKLRILAMEGVDIGKMAARAKQVEVIAKARAAKEAKKKAADEKLQKKRVAEAMERAENKRIEQLAAKLLAEKDAKEAEEAQQTV